MCFGRWILSCSFTHYYGLLLLLVWIMKLVNLCNVPKKKIILNKDNSSLLTLSPLFFSPILFFFALTEVHIMLDGLLPPDTYFRFNPVMCENIPLDESRNEKLDQLQLEGLKYIERNEQKMKKVAKILSQEKTTLQKINDWIKLKTDMYEGLPFFSKLWWVYAYGLINEALFRRSTTFNKELWDSTWVNFEILMNSGESWKRWCFDQLAQHREYSWLQNSYGN